MNWLKLASVCAALTVLAGLLVAIPTLLWTPSAIVACLLCAALVGGLFWVTTPAAARPDHNAAALASIGPSSALLAMLLPWSAGAVAVALSGHTTAAWFMHVITVGGLLVATALLKAASLVITANESSGSPGPRTQWATQLVSMGAMAAAAQDASLQARLSRLADDLRYSPSDIRGRPAAENEAIGTTMAALALSMRHKNLADAASQAEELAALFASRAASLQTARSKA